jgi:DNA-directed RNA polymerase specialized sigma24 family protein
MIQSISPVPNYSSIQTMFFDDHGNVLPDTKPGGIPTPTPASAAKVAQPLPQPRPYIPVYLPYRGAFVNRPEWSKHNSRGDRPLESRRFYKKKVNHAHDLYMEGRIGLERYVEEIISYVDTVEDVSKVRDAIYAFIAANAAALEDKTFCSFDSPVRFSTKVNSHWEVFREKAGCYPSPDGQQGQDEATAFYGEWVLSQPQWGNDAIASLKRYKLQYDLADGFRRWKAIGDERPLNEAILKISRSKAKTQMRDAYDADKTYEDIAQEIAITVWAQLNLPEGAKGGFHGGPGDIYFWLQTIANRTGKKAFHANIKEVESIKLPLLVQVKDDDGELSEELVENPLLHEGWFRERRQLPDWMTFKDKEICRLMRDGVTEYAAIGQELGLTPSAVENRVRKMRQRNMAEHSEKLQNRKENDASYAAYLKPNNLK